MHIPFCLKKCEYCDFYSVTSKDLQDDYVNALINEIESYRDKFLSKEIRTIYFGGGTPSLLDINNVKRIIDKIFEFDTKNDIEITFEANPETLSLEYLRQLKETNVNRLSIGMQSMDDNILKQIGRVHTAQKFEEQYSNARLVGFDNISIDVMFGFHEQTVSDLMQTLKKVIELSPEHISFLV